MTGPGRTTMLLNRDWRFIYGDPAGAVLPNFDDEEWYDVGIPHSFGIPYFMETEFYTGRGTYRRWFELDEEAVRRRVAIEFHGVFQDATVLVNGVEVGRHRGGYTAFEIDVTTAVHTGRNLLAVRVSNEWDPTLAPRAGEHVFNGGIYRDVALIVGDRRRIAWYGTFVRAAVVTDDAAEVLIDTEVVNGADVPLDGAVITVLRGPDGVVVAQGSASVRLAPGATGTVIQRLQIPTAARWSPEQPLLHRAEQVLEFEGGEVDAAVTEFGVRTLEFTADRGFFLNGEHVWIDGANVHQDHAGWSDAVTHAGIKRDVGLIKDAGLNFIRGSHYPHHDRFATECDQQGMLLWSELAFWGIGGQNAEGFWNASAYPPLPEHQKAFEESCMQQMREMIRVNRNHPSIVVWSTGNEVFFSDDEVIPQAKRLTVALADLAHELDPTRPVAVGGAQRRGFDVLADIAGYNGDGATLYPDPGMPNLVSEYGSFIEDRPGESGDRRIDNTGERHPWRSGVVLWCGFHHGSIVRDMGRMGFVDYYRLPLRSWFEYRRERLGIEPPEPARIGTPVRTQVRVDRDRIGTDGTDDAMILVDLVDEKGTVIDDARTVLLEVIEGGGLLPTGTALELGPINGGMRAGSGAIELRAYAAGPIRIRATAEGLAPSEVALTAHGGPIFTGAPRRLQSGPPSISGISRTAERRVLSEKRPAFSSGAAEGHPAGAVTDPTVAGGWRSASGDAGAWLRVDLEGSWDVDLIRLRFGSGDPVSYELLTGSDGDEQQVLASGITPSGPIDHDTAGRRMRSVLIRFPGPPREVVELLVLGR